MTPEERQFAASRLLELAGQIRDQLGLLDGHTDEQLLLKTAESVAVLAEVLAAVVEDQPEAGG